MNDLFDLTGKVALVTGASRGLGRAMALALAEAGCDLVLNARSADALKEVSGKVKAIGRKFELAPGDVSEEAQADKVLDQALKTFGRIDVLVNNAGIWEGSYLVRLKKADWENVLKVNMTGAFLMAKGAAKVMLKQRSGKIINLSSISGFKPIPQSLAYAASKAAVLQMTRVMAVELGPAGIQVNGIAPGFFDTDMTSRYQQPDGKEVFEKYVSRIPLRKIGKPEDLGGLVVFLASRASDHMTGQTVVIDGGESLV